MSRAFEIGDKVVLNGHTKNPIYGRVVCTDVVGGYPIGVLIESTASAIETFWRFKENGQGMTQTSRIAHAPELRYRNLNVLATDDNWFINADNMLRRRNTSSGRSIGHLEAELDENGNLTNFKFVSLEEEKL